MVDGLREYVPLGPDETRARAAYHRLQADLASGRRPRVQVTTMSDLADEWIAAMTAAGRKPRTIGTYTLYARYVVQALGPMHPGDVDGYVIAEFRRHHEEAGRSRRYTSFIVGALAQMLRYAYAEKVITVLPIEARGVKTPGPAAPRRSLSIAECERLIEHLPRGWHDAGEVILLTGLRIGELLALTPESVDTERGVIHVTATRGKGNRVGSPKTTSSERVVHLTPRARELVKARVTLTRPGEFLWPGSTTGAAADAMRDAKRAAGLVIPGVGWHALRHAATMLMDRAGVPLRASAQQLGHGAHTAMTMGYGWAAEGADVAAVDEARKHAATPGTGGSPSAPGD